MQTGHMDEPPNDLELMRIHVEALFTHDPQGRMVRVNEPGGKEAPRFFLGRTAQGHVWRVRGDVDDALVRELAAACAAEPHAEPPPRATDRAAGYAALLARWAPVVGTWAGPAYCFPEAVAAPRDTVPVTAENAGVLRPHLAAWREDVARGRPMLALLAEGRAVAVCCSVRVTDMAHEAGVETAPEFRGRGCAAQVVAAWALAIRRMGRIPLYSTSWENTASRAVARKLGLAQFGADLHLT
jgi:RimJ/RimL family protein N-acetyltransferase